MDGFVARERRAAHLACARASTTPAARSVSRAAPDVMGYHDGREIPNYWAYAHDFVLQDHMFESDTSWSLPVHLYLVSGWSAQLRDARRADELPSRGRRRRRAARRAAEPDGAAARLRLDRPHLPPPQGPRQLALLRRRAATSPTAATARCSVQAVPQSAEDAGHLEPAARSSTPSARTTNSATSSRSQLSTRGAGGNAAGRLVDRAAQAVSEHPPALVSDGPGLRHRPDQHDHAEPRLDARPPSSSRGTTGAASTTTSCRRRATQTATACACPALVISPYARQGYIDHQTLSFDAYLKFIEDDFLGGARLDPADRRPARPAPRRAREREDLGNLASDFNFNQPPRPAVLLPLALASAES